MNISSNRWRPKFRFSLRSLLLVITLLSLWLATQANRAKRQKLAVSVVQELGGEVQYDYQLSRFEKARRTVKGLRPPSVIEEPSGPKWLRQLVGNEYFQRVVGVDFRYSADISGPVMEHITSLTDLEELFLTNTNITDSDLRDIGKLSNLRLLVIRDNQITDAGISHLHSLTRLEQLNVINTSVTADGVAKLKEYLPECLVHLEEPPTSSEKSEEGSRYRLPASSSIFLPRPSEF